MNGSEGDDRHEESSADKWADEGRRLLQVKAGWRASGRDIANSASYAYQSLPVDVSADGQYELEFGPLDPAFNYPENPTGVVFDFPSDIHFTIMPTGKASTVIVGEKRYFKVEVSVTNLTRPYTGMTAWIY